MTQQNHQWIERLTTDGAVRDQALDELRALLVARLQRAFHNRPKLSGHFAEDIVQDSLIKILENLNTFEGRSQFTTWATTIAIRTAYSELRKKEWQNVSLEQLVSESSMLANHSTSTEPTPDVATGQSELVAIMYQTIREDLSDKQRNALLAELHGMPLEEIARRTGSNRNAVYKVTHDARKRLKRSLEERGFTSEDWQAVGT